MVRISWTPQSLSDLEAIIDYIGKDSVRYAQLFADKIFYSVDKLESFPYLGRMVPEVNEEYIREIIFGNYRIVYRVKEDEIEIITIYHTSRILNLENII